MYAMVAVIGVIIETKFGSLPKILQMWPFLCMNVADTILAHLTSWVGGMERNYLWMNGSPSNLDPP